MKGYKAPLADMRFLLEQVFDAQNEWQQLPAFAEMADLETAVAVLEESAKLNEQVVAPLDRNADEQGVSFENGIVKTPDGFADAYGQFAEGGWIGLCGNPEFGGMGMPKSLGVLTDEIGYGASNAFQLYGSLTAGAALCINAHGSDELKEKFLPSLYSGAWTGAMDMTEPQAGSDLRGIRTKAEIQDNGSYKISGSKIFITSGDNDLGENVVHLVLAKIATDKGLSKNISLFLVPKILVNDDGSLGDANGVSVGSIEHKMGLKGSATCVMNYDDAEGYLIGQEGRGLAAMFTMMNYERVSIGIQGLGASEMAYQLAAEYAKERRQGVAADKSMRSGEFNDSLLVHGDVRRMLLNIRSLNEAGRAFAVHTGLQLDIANYGEGEAAEWAGAQVGLLTPLAKAFLTDRGLDSTVAGQQVFGGHGFIREWGAEQLVRDCRIAQIYEGTNGIQALDLLGRKVVANRGENMKRLLEQFSAETSAMTNVDAGHKDSVLTAFAELQGATAELVDAARNDANLVNCAAVDYLNAVGYTLFGYFWLRMCNVADEQADEQFASDKRLVTDYYVKRVMPLAAHHLRLISTGAGATMALELDRF
ncbi:acyl-CoA dehydrogenase C-terminal domain-containing protein [Paraferrimonas sedimenticola]|uniref:3-methylmercaptopropionyl-CoA dehydrogenase n=1 Tax=Paraferrimonas sedimenticola TaxID=375674 RepID=A0AA37VX80_9GAMM|nr:acyl-CoA dehydrogenase C-terminal domain-containing protein [Paraferrimonas sedimenticola]GLP96611.1 acyl-CoA dehydrogenase [Paraferrimonas sedimenticola]